MREFIMISFPTLANTEMPDVEIDDNGMVDFPSGDTTVCVGAEILSDGILEADEIFRFSVLTSDSNVVTVMGEPVDITIVNTDSEFAVY
jgi:hypothetical protein